MNDFVIVKKILTSKGKRKLKRKWKILPEQSESVVNPKLIKMMIKIFKNKDERKRHN
jgi:hypothetical protein